MYIDIDMVNQLAYSPLQILLSFVDLLSNAGCHLNAILDPFTNRGGTILIGRYYLVTVETIRVQAEGTSTMLNTFLAFQMWFLTSCPIYLYLTQP